MPIPSPVKTTITEPPPVDVYASERENGAIWRVEATSGLLTVTANDIDYGDDLAVDAAGNLFVPRPDGVVELPAGGGAPTQIYTGVFVVGIAADPAGNLYVVNFDGDQALKIHRGGGSATVIWNGPSDAWGIACDAFENAYILRIHPVVVVKVPASGASPTTIDPSGIFPNEVTPAFTVDPQGQNLYLSRLDMTSLDSQGLPQYSTILKVPLNGDPHTSFGTDLRAIGLAADTKGNVYIADSLNDRILMVTNSGSGRQVTIAPLTGAERVAIPPGVPERPRLPNLTGKLFGDAAADGGGWIVIGNQFVPVPPRSPVMALLVQAALRYRGRAVEDRKSVV